MKKATILFFSVFALLAGNRSAAQPRKLNPSLLIKPVEFNKIVSRPTPEVHERMMRPYLLKQTTQQKLLLAYKGNYEKINPPIGSGLPSKYDWRDKGMVTSVKDQGGFGTCWTFSETAAVESNYLIETGESLDLAEQDMINCGCRRNGTCGPGNGSDLGNAYIDNLIKTGWGIESSNPYVGDENMNPIDCSKRCGTCNQTKEKPYGAEILEQMTKDANGNELGEYDFIPEDVIKKAVLDHGPLDICIWIPPGSKIGALDKTNDVLDEKFTYTSGTSDAIEYFKTTVDYLPKTFSSADINFGGHLLLLIGWDDSKNAWLLKNSWGTGSGTDGFIWIKYRSNYICSKRLSPQWVKARTPDFLVTAVWKKDNADEVQVYDWNYDNFKNKYDGLWAQGWRLSVLKNTVKNNEIRYSAVWRKTNADEVQVYGWAYEDFRKKYDELWGKGWRLKLLDNFVYMGKILYSAVWQKSTAEEVQVYGWAYDDFRKKYDELYPQGWRLKLLNNFIYGGKVLYTAVWQKTAGDEYQVYGWNYADFRKKYDEIWPQGWRLKLLNNYVDNGVVKYTAAFTKSTAPEVQVYTWPYTDFRKKDAEMRKQGWSIGAVNVY